MAFPSEKETYTVQGLETSELHETKFNKLAPLKAYTIDFLNPVLFTVKKTWFYRPRSPPRHTEGESAYGEGVELALFQGTSCDFE